MEIKRGRRPIPPLPRTPSRGDVKRLRHRLYEIIFEADTTAGKWFDVALIMVIGYGIIAVPTGIVTVELTQAVQREVSTQACLGCGGDGHDRDAVFCKY